MILDGRDAAQVRRAALALAQGQLVALPTETVYGLGADATQDAAVARIFQAKGRPADHPLIVHVAGISDARQFTRDWPDYALALAQRYWPGPLTLILPRRDGIAAAAAGGQSSVGLRCPSHPVAQALLQAAHELEVAGVAAPSANRFGRVSPTTAQHVESELGSELLVLDGGPCEVGIESTIVDCTHATPVLLRPGRITRDEVSRTCGCDVLSPDQVGGPVTRASGTLESHYAPRARVRLMGTQALQAALEVLGSTLDQASAPIAVYARTLMPLPSRHMIFRRMPDDAAGAAQELFAALRRFDDQGVGLIWVEQPPDGDDWEGVRDRLRRAAH